MDDVSTTPAPLACKCCGEEAPFFGKADFNKCLSDRFGKVFPDSGIAVHYHRCPSCGLVFTPHTDGWSPQKLKAAIYNEAYAVADPDVGGKRAAKAISLLKRLFGKRLEGLRMLGFGQGEAALVRLAQGRGLTDITGHDPFFSRVPLPPGGDFDLVLAFEVLEHFHDPSEFFSKTATLIGDEGGILFSTLLQPENIETMGAGWWYAAPRNGHVCLHTQKSLSLLCGRHGLKLKSLNPSLHFAWLGDPAFARSITGSEAASLQLFKGLSPFRPKYTALAQCRYGPMLYLTTDKFVGTSLSLYREFSELEVRLFRSLVRPGDVVVEVGASMGVHTVFFGRAVGPAGRVFSFEPQPFLFQLMCANIAMNELTNVQPRNVAISDEAGTMFLPAADLSRTRNYSGTSLKDHGEIPVETRPLDAYDLNRLDLLQVDVEGMEKRVLEGAAKTIARHRPVIYLENDRKEASAELIHHLQGLGYRMWWHLPPLFNPDNHAGNTENVFPRIVSINMLCLPREREQAVEGLREVASTQDRP